MANTSEPREITIRDLYPHLTEEQLVEAEANLKTYIDLSIRMFERIRKDPEAWTRFQMLKHERLLEMRRKRFEKTGD